VVIEVTIVRKKNFLGMEDQKMWPCTCVVLPDDGRKVANADVAVGVSSEKYKD
jgi:hypothetical protein